MEFTSIPLLLCVYVTAVRIEIDRKNKHTVYLSTVASHNRISTLKEPNCDIFYVVCLKATFRLCFECVYFSPLAHNNRFFHCLNNSTWKSTFAWIIRRGNWRFWIHYIGNNDFQIKASSLWKWVETKDESQISLKGQMQQSAKFST